MDITAKMVKELRDRTSAGMMDCKKALEASEGDVAKAVVLLREKGLATAAKREAKEAKHGVVACYVHAGSKLGAIVEVNCETDFVANTEEFRHFADEVAKQVAAMTPKYVDVPDVPQEEIEAESEVYRGQAIEDGKPEKALGNIVQGRLRKYYSQVCLLEQEYIRDEKMTVRDLMNDLITQCGEKVVISRFAVLRVGQPAVAARIASAAAENATGE